ncbi:MULTISPECIES: bifunctional nuclease domain-containing protein [unclassified Thioalkalivibrio]|uniref:bifunctional nuclease domain-containing protein n=1 Tax=unclassified Thioalkalivibrio TaxID=2621013 RepID=UPI000377583E|nr:MULTISPECIES: bifunctional nuclease domain-containing protein [unclassified Thioalkalivibrio]
MSHPRWFAWPRVLIVSLVFTLTLAASDTLAREVDPEALERVLPVELATVGMDAQTGAPIALLRDPDSGEVVPIVIGPDQAQAILLAMHEVQLSRPQTHDLMINLLDELNATLERVIVDGLVDGTYLGWLELRVEGEEEPRYIDTRPSDGLALAVRTGATIAVSPDVLEADVPFEYSPPGDDEVVTALGITVIAVRDDLREALELPDEPGVLVSRAQGAAAAAGLAQGALILEVNGQTPETPIEFLDAVSETPDGEEAEIRFWLDGEERTITLPTDVPQIEESDDALAV